MPSERALVIGASGGIGAALAEALEARGARVTRLSRRHDGFDVTDATSIERVLGALEGPYELILVAIGILAPQGLGPEKSLGAIDAQAMAHVFAVNAIGPALILRHLPRLIAPGGRAGVLSARVGSIEDNEIGGWHSYRASKAALNQIVHGAAIELKRHDRAALLVALHPGTVETGFTAAYAGKHRMVAAPEAAANLLAVIEGLEPAQSGGFYDWRGEAVPW
ncbi:SDR family NAD(P)-dependent oxidoreductase [Limimaricola litoreus]|uniref:SDR family NAD(P)-dependent oxidoreductase n=1 Tax=Limimaricola litoreus TaxID=2955316 RepID=A0A9X2FRL7_9RHOB|nr:SDR family NAD(P)-dependent oxidoreductase [Limimaricola litoreus]MCP1169325.1 SDR family NAD(P)-dependent oxidoreductase [Limimaricola litoreus]